MNNKYIQLSLAALVLSFSHVTNAEDHGLGGEELPAIDLTITPFDETEETPAVMPKKQELTEDQQAEAKELQEKAVEIYSDLLTFDSSSRLKSVESNMEYLQEALEKAQARLKKEIANYKSLNNDVYGKKKRIDAMQVSQPLKDKRLIELKELYEQRKDSMTYAMDELAKRIVTLKERIATYHAELTDLRMISEEKGAKKELTWAEKDKQRKNEALTTFDKIEDELINKEYDKYLK